jgi:hypothetical protein
MYDAYPNLGPIKNTNDERLSMFPLLASPSMIHNVIKYINNPIPGHPDSVNAQGYKWNPSIPIKIIARELKWRPSEVIEMVSNCKMKMGYQIKSTNSYHHVSHNYDYWYDNFKEDFDPMFNIEFNDDKSKCTFLFNTGFSICFIHNLYCHGYELINDQLYDLSESSQIIYRKRFFSFNSMTTKLNLKYIINHLGLTNKNLGEKKKLLKKITTELVDKKLVNLIEDHGDWVLLTKGKDIERKVIEFKPRKSGTVS